MPGEITAVLSAVCYSLSYLVLRKGQTETSAPDNGLFPVLLVSALVLGGGLILSFIADDPPSIPSENWMWAVFYCVLTGAIGTVCGRLALYGAIHYLGATRGVVIKTLAPFVTMTIAITLLDENLDEFDITGILLLFAGIALLLTERVWIRHRFSIGSRFQTGILLGLSAALLQGIGHAFRKLGVDFGLSPLFAAAIEAISALSLYIVGLAVLGRLNHYVTHYLRARNVTFLAAGCLSAAGVLLFFTALASVPVSTVSVIIGTEPILVALLSALFLRNVEHLTWVIGVSSVLVACGIVFMNFA